MMKHQASCCCEQLKLTYDGEIKSTAICHCAACQKRTGSAFGMQFAVPKEKVKIEGETKKYTRTALTGTLLDFYFCPNCGSTVFWEMGDVPDMYAIAAGCFANSQLPSPSLSVYTMRKHDWFQLPETIVTRWNIQDE